MTKKNPPNPMNRGAQLLYRWRYDKGLRQRDCCKLFDCDQAQLSKWETGKITPSRKMAVTIERLTMNVVTCGSWDDEPLPSYEVDPVLNPDFDPHLAPKG